MRPKVIVTGATGVIGSYAVPLLMQKGFDVIAASRSGSGPCGVSLDIHEAHAVNALMASERPECLLHLAWNINDGYSDSPENLDWVSSSLHLLKCFAANGGRRAVFAGTCYEYDLRYGFLTEDFTPLNASSFYGLAKSSLYTLATSWAKCSNFSFAWGRIFMIYGCGERRERIVPYIIDSFLQGRKPEIRYPYIQRDYMYAGDAANAMIALMMCSYTGAVNIASGSAIPLCEIARKTALLMGCPVPEYPIVSEDNIPPLILGDTRRMNRVTGFRPQTSWEEGLAEMITWRKKLYYEGGLLTNMKKSIMDSGSADFLLRYSSIAA